MQAPAIKSSREAYRDEMRKSGAMKKHAGHYGRGLRNWCNRIAAQKQKAK